MVSDIKSTVKCTCGKELNIQTIMHGFGRDNPYRGEFHQNSIEMVVEPCPKCIKKSIKKPAKVLTDTFCYEKNGKFYTTKGDVEISVMPKKTAELIQKINKELDK